MNSRINIYSILLIALASMLVMCHEQLTFLSNSEESSQTNDIFIIDSVVEDQQKKNFTSEEFKAIPDYDIYVLSIQWGNTLCLSNTICKEKIKTLRKNIMTLHGLWPNLKSGSSLPDCNSGQSIPVKIKDATLLNSMQANWPSFTGPDEKFWTHEYNKHGFCYTNKSKTEGYLPYFKLGMDIFKQRELESIISEIVDKSKETEIAIRTTELRSFIGSKYPELFYDFDCIKIGTKTYLAEIRIYLNLEFVSFKPPKSKSGCPASQPIYIAKYVE